MSQIITLEDKPIGILYEFNYNCEVFLLDYYIDNHTLIDSFINKTDIKITYKKHLSKDGEDFIIAIIKFDKKHKSKIINMLEDLYDINDDRIDKFHNILKTIFGSDIIDNNGS